MNRSFIVCLTLCLGVALGAMLARIAPQPVSAQTIEWLKNPRPLASFTLDSETGTFDNQSLLGRWTIVTLGFLQCPDICPTNLSQMATLASSLAEESSEQEVAFVFVSVDSGRDSVAQLSRYVQHFDASIRGVTGEPEQLENLTRKLGVAFKVSANSAEYTVSHSVTFSIIDPEGMLRGRFRPGFDVPNLVRDFAHHLIRLSGLEE